MAQMYQDQDPNFYNTIQAEIEVEIEVEQGTVPAEETRSFCESALGTFIEELRYQGIPNQQGDMNLVACICLYITNPNQGSYQSPLELQLEGKETSVAGVPQPAEVPEFAQEPECAQVQTCAEVIEWVQVPEWAQVQNCAEVIEWAQVQDCAEVPEWAQDQDCAEVIECAQVREWAQGQECAQVLEWAEVPEFPQVQECSEVPLSAGVPHPRRNTRPRIRRGVTSWQLSELERVFEDDQYPNEITKKNLARRLYMKPSEVHCWFKKRRAKYRKNQRLQMVKGAPDGTFHISH